MFHLLQVSLFFIPPTHFFLPPGAFLWVYIPLHTSHLSSRHNTAGNTDLMNWLKHAAQSALTVTFITRARIYCVFYALFLF